MFFIEWSLVQLPVVVMILIVHGFIDNRRYARTRRTADERALKAAAEDRSESSSSRASNQRRLTRTNTIAVVVVVSAFVIADVTIIVSATHAVVHALIIILLMIIPSPRIVSPLSGRRYDRAEQKPHADEIDAKCVHDSPFSWTTSSPGK
jgi:Na+/H+ antiporter NhaD/arsenite permease-like protein